MSEISQLIDVTFTDVTSYTPDAGQDVIGTPIEHCWGPVGSLNVFTLESFLSTYPEALPIGSPQNQSVAFMYAWAQLRRALAAGASQVETIRVQGNWKYSQWNISYGTEYAITALESTAQFSEASGTVLSIASKYPGRPPKSEYGDYKKIKLSVVLGTETPITITVLGVKSDSSEVVLETHRGSFDTDAIEDGQTFYITTVLERDSDLIAAKIIGTPTAVLSDITLAASQLDLVFPTALVASDYESALLSFSDPETSATTILLAPLNGDNDVNAACASIVKESKAANFVVGLPVGTVLTKTNIENFIQSSLPAATYDMFTMFVAAKETYSVAGKSILMDGTAGWAGRVSAVAYNKRINQLPSARAYGSYDGILTQTLSFEDVLSLHKVGVISIYTSSQGARIFGIRDRHPRQSSYFARANVSRVITRFLRLVFPEVLTVIHTEVVSDSTQRAIFEATLSRIVDDFISRGNINPASYVDISDSINSDNQTNGGEILNIRFTMYFKKLMEKANIQIIATDSSVDVSIT